MEDVPTTICWRDDTGQLHRDNDQPALIHRVVWGHNDITWSQSWYQRGQLHRDNDQPAVIDSDGSRQWYQHGQLHRDNGQPAVIQYIRWGIESHAHVQSWYQHGQLQ